MSQFKDFLFPVPNITQQVSHPINDYPEETCLLLACSTEDSKLLQGLAVSQSYSQQQPRQQIG